MPMFRINTTFIDGRRDSYIAELAHGFAAVDEALARYGAPAVSRIAAIHVRDASINPHNLPIICVEGYTGQLPTGPRPPWQCAGCMRSNPAWLLRCDGCGGSEKLPDKL